MTALKKAKMGDMESSAMPERTSSKPSSASAIARSTLTVMGGLASSMIIGLVRERIVAAKFGTHAALDAYTAADTIPQLLVTMLSGGALAFAFIPVYTEFLTKGDKQGSNRLASQVINTIFLLASLAALIVAVFTPVIVEAPWGVGANFPADTQRLTIQLMRILLLSTMVFTTSSFLTGALHAHQHFLLPAIAPSLYNGGIIFGSLFLEPTMGISGLAWGAVLGALLHLLIQIPGIVHHRIRWYPTLDWKNPALRRVAVLMAPRVIDLFMARASIEWLNANLGSGLGEGRVSALRYALKLMNTPWTLIGTAIGFAVFPTMAALAAEKDINAQRSALSGALRAILTLALPAAIGLIVLGRPAIGIILEGGEFTPESIELVYYALKFYTVALISQSMLEVVVRAFAAQQDTLTPLLVSLFTTTLNIALAIWLARPLVEGGLEHGGLALANGVAVGIESLIGLAILHKRWHGVDARRILLDAGKAAIAATVMGVSILAFRTLFNPGRLTLLLIGGALGLAIYFGLALLFGMQEIRSLPSALLSRIRGNETSK